jgi:hypothetical protein
MSERNGVATKTFASNFSSRSRILGFAREIEANRGCRQSHCGRQSSGLWPDSLPTLQMAAERIKPLVLR